MKFKKVAFVLAFAFGFSVPVMAARGVIEDQRTLVQVRGVFEELGFSVDWNAENATATIKDGEHTISIQKGQNYFTADGKDVVPDVPQQIIDGKFYLPLRAVGESVGAQLNWNGNTKVAVIKYSGKSATVYCGDEEEESTVEETAPATEEPKDIEATYTVFSHEGEAVQTANTTNNHQTKGNSVKGTSNSQAKKTVEETKTTVVKSNRDPNKNSSVKLYSKYNYVPDLGALANTVLVSKEEVKTDALYKYNASSINADYEREYYEKLLGEYGFVFDKAAADKKTSELGIETNAFNKVLAKTTLYTYKEGDYFYVKVEVSKK